MKLSDFCSGIQHIGIPTNDLAASEKFYDDLGFAVVYRGYVPEKNQHVFFMQMHDLVLELYEETPALRDGAVDHIALNCLDIETAYCLAKEQGYRFLSDGICSLGFWEKGIKYFIIEGPNKERLEFCQKL